MLPLDENEYYEQRNESFYDQPWVMDPHDWDQDPDRNERPVQPTIQQEFDELELEYITVKSDRDRLLDNISRLTGVDVYDLPPSGIAMDEFLDAWIDRERKRK